MFSPTPDYYRAIRSAAWMWCLYLAILGFVDLVIYVHADGPIMPILWYHLVSTLPAVVFLGLSYSKWLKSGARGTTAVMILLVSTAPILVDYLLNFPLPPGPLANTEGMVLRQLPVLLIGLVLVAWRCPLATMAVYSMVLNGFDLLLVIALHRIEDPRYSAMFLIIFIRTVCFLVMGLFIHQLVEHMRMLIIRDPLTGLYNRYYLNEFVKQTIARAGREQTTIAFVLIDIDNFKRLNDTYGHIGGDAMLQSVGKLLERNIRQGDIACRFGGEEFLLVLPGALLEDACVRTDKIRTTLEAMRVGFEGRHLHVTFSAGVAEYPTHGGTMDAVMKVADRSLYEAKTAGKNCVCCPQLLLNPGPLQLEDTVRYDW